MPSATLLNCSSPMPSRVIRMPTRGGDRRLSRRAMPQRATSLTAGRRPCHPTPCRASPPTSAPPVRTSRNWLVKGRLSTTDNDIVLLVRNPTPLPTPNVPDPAGRAAVLLNDEPVHIYVHLLMRPWIVQGCQSTASVHLGTTRTSHILERFYSCIGMNVCTRWWLRHRLKCEARKTPRMAVRWPITSMPLP